MVEDTLGQAFEAFSLGITFSVKGVTNKLSVHAPTSLSVGLVSFWAWALHLASFNLSKLSTIFCKLFDSDDSSMYKDDNNLFHFSSMTSQ